MAAIHTNVPGMEICEAFPRLAKMADKYTIIRSLIGNQADHDAIQVFNGHHPKNPKPAGGWPQFGSMVAKVLGPAQPCTPPYVSMCYQCSHGPYNEPGPGFLGASNDSFRPLDRLGKIWCSTASPWIAWAIAFRCCAISTRSNAISMPRAHGGYGLVHGTSHGLADFVEASRSPRLVERRSEGGRALWYGQPEDIHRQQRSSARAAEHADRATPD